MRQSRLMSLVKAIANVVVRLVLSVATQVVVFPILGLQALLGQNVRLALIITVVLIGPELRSQATLSSRCDDTRSRPRGRGDIQAEPKDWLIRPTG